MMVWAYYVDVSELIDESRYVGGDDLWPWDVRKVGR